MDKEKIIKILSVINDYRFEDDVTKIFNEEYFGLKKEEYNLLIERLVHEKLVIGFLEVPIMNQNYKSYKPKIPQLTTKGEEYLKQTAKRSEPVPHVFNTFNFNGANARFNNNSSDSSINVVAESSKLFEEIRKVINENIQDDEQQHVIIGIVDEMESNLGTPSFKEKYTKFIQGLGDHITVLSPFIPQLAGLL